MGGAHLNSEVQELGCAPPNYTDQPLSYYAGLGALLPNLLTGGLDIVVNALVGLVLHNIQGLEIIASGLLGNTLKKC